MSKTECKRCEAMEAVIEVVDKCCGEMDVVSVNVPRNKVFSFYRDLCAIDALFGNQSQQIRQR